MEYEVLFSPVFIRKTKHLKKDLRQKLDKCVEKIIEDPERGKPLEYSYKNIRSIRIKPFRVLYRYHSKTIEFLTFEHREKVY